MKTELRYSIGSELRAMKNFEISGLASVYNTPSANLGGFKEVVVPGAFSNSLKNGVDVKCLLNHDPNQVLGRTKSGTCQLEDTPAGLKFTCQLDKDNSIHQSAYRMIQRGDISECSFAFTVPQGGDDFSDFGDKDESGAPLMRRHLRNVNLLDVSAVTYPAYPSGTQVVARSLNGVKIDSVGAYIFPVRVNVTDAQRRAKADRLGELVLADVFKMQRELAEDERKRNELRQRMASAAGINFGRTRS